MNYEKRHFDLFKMCFTFNNNVSRCRQDVIMTSILFFVNYVICLFSKEDAKSIVFKIKSFPNLGQKMPKERTKKQSQKVAKLIKKPNKLAKEGKNTSQLVEKVSKATLIRTRSKRSIATSKESSTNSLENPKRRKEADQDVLSERNDEMRKSPPASGCFRRVLLKELAAGEINLSQEELAQLGQNNNATIELQDQHVVGSAKSLIQSIKNKKLSSPQGKGKKGAKVADRFYKEIPQPGNSQAPVVDQLGDGVQVEVDPKDDEYLEERESSQVRVIKQISPDVSDQEQSDLESIESSSASSSDSTSSESSSEDSSPHKRRRRNKHHSSKHHRSQRSCST